MKTTTIFTLLGVAAGLYFLTREEQVVRVNPRVRVPPGDDGTEIGLAS